METKEHDRSVLLSPNGKFALLVTTEGDIAQDAATSELWLIDVAEAEAYVSARRLRKPTVKLIASKTAVPESHATVPYKSLITDVEWAADSRTVYFLAQGKRGTRSIYEVDIGVDKVRSLTPSNLDVTNYALAAEEIAFAATDVKATELLVSKLHAGIAMNKDALFIGDVSLTSVLFPAFNSARVVESEIGLISLTKPSKIRFIGPSNVTPSSDIYNVLSLSPDGKTVITIRSAKEAPLKWEQYHSAVAAARPPVEKKDTRGLNIFDDPYLLREYVAIDVSTGKEWALTSAPVASSYGYLDKTVVSWSREGREALVTGTFLPLDDKAEASDWDARKRPCYALFISFRDGGRECLSYSYFESSLSDIDPRKRVLRGAEFIAAGSGIRLTYQNYSPLSSIIVESYSRMDGRWALNTGAAEPRAGSAAGEETALSALSIKLWVKQGIDTPPALVVTDIRTNRTRPIWNPNPFLSNRLVGKASVFTWIDEGGHQWTGGLVKPVGFRAGVRYPLIIQTYSFDGNEFLVDGSTTTAEAALALASAGFLVLQIQKRFDRVSTPDEAAVQVRGFRSAIAVLTRDGLVDKDRVGIIGFSRGCYYASYALTHEPGMFASAIVADGWDQGYLQHIMFSEAAAQDDTIYGVEPFGRGLNYWINTAPSFNYYKIAASVMIEAIGPASLLSEWEMYSSLRQLKKPVDLIYYPKGQHILQRPRERLASQQATIDWFRFWLQGLEDSSPSKAQQYRNWEKLCAARVGNHLHEMLSCVRTKNTLLKH